MKRSCEEMDAYSDGYLSLSKKCRNKKISQMDYTEEEVFSKPDKGNMIMETTQLNCAQLDSKNTESFGNNVADININFKIIQDNQLHMAACNFVKKPGHTYHLYQRPSGLQYFSMLSLEDWNGMNPHNFLGSWHLEMDQSWTRIE